MRWGALFGLGLGVFGCSTAADDPIQESHSKFEETSTRPLAQSIGVRMYRDGSEQTGPYVRDYRGHCAAIQTDQFVCPKLLAFAMTDATPVPQTLRAAAVLIAKNLRSDGSFTEPDNAAEKDLSGFLSDSDVNDYESLLRKIATPLKEEAATSFVKEVRIAHHAILQNNHLGHHRFEAKQGRCPITAWYTADLGTEGHAHASDILVLLIEERANGCKPQS